MHYHCEIWLPTVPMKAGKVNREELQGILEEILAPYSESTEGADNPFWDWWQIGGRYTGRHDKYIPWEDPINQEPCDLCNATGRRPDATDEDRKHTRGCNGCGGQGVKTSYGYAPHEEDVMPVKDIRADLECYTLIIGEEGNTQVYHTEEWDKEDEDFKKNKVFDGNNIKAFLKSKKITTGYLVLVDYHC